MWLIPQNAVLGERASFQWPTRSRKWCGFSGSA
jgi:hypothetical protein